jgi:Fe-S-cluster-containing dehydrogenase component
MEGLDPHTGFVVRSDLCTGCAMCVISCSSIKHDTYSFSNVHSFVEVTPRPRPAEFDVRFTEECDGCLYCLKFCAFEAIEKPDGWVKAPHLAEITRRHREVLTSGDPATTRTT